MADPTFALARGLAQRVEVRIVAVTENAALFQRERWIIQQRVGQFLSERRHFANGVLQMGRMGQMRHICGPGSEAQPVNEFAKLTLERGDLLQRRFQCDKVTRVP
ncbi:MAG: hypothetical protein Udaeo_06070 [Candidatus Udaeobacter sp.]|nr:MAG: hypothetical protein Udaeo_06070 [Candidatus Udaeobacter sp.]